MKTRRISLGLDDALRLVFENIRSMPAEDAALIDSIGRVAASDLKALVDSPPTDTSRKDGYAVIADDVAGATERSPVRLKVTGSLTAGGRETMPQVGPGTAVRVMTGAPLPPGANAVIAREYTRDEDADVAIEAPVGDVVNILRRGADTSAGTTILRAGHRITPSMAGLLAVAGYGIVPVFRNPVVGIIGTGDEIVEAGKPLGEGQLYASNIVTLAGWCQRCGVGHRSLIVADDHDLIVDAMRMLIDETDAIITSGGAWMGDRDLVVGALETLGWARIFHGIRMGPGKAIGFGTLDDKPVFILPGGPPSNLMGFLQVVLPGLLTLCGLRDRSLPLATARLGSDIDEGDVEWTDFFYGVLEPGEDLPVFCPLPKRTRLSSIAQASAVASVPEGLDRLSKGSLIRVQMLS